MKFSVHVKMWLKKAAFFIVFNHLAFFANARTRLTVGCGRNGFSCITAENSVSYSCPGNEQDILIKLWYFGEGSYVRNVTISNCKKLELDLSCTGTRKSFQTVTIANITDLEFTRSWGTMKNPVKLVLRNIENIEIIPENTFTVPYMMKPLGDADQNELQEVSFENVHIGTIESHAFHKLRGFRKFLWQNVHVDRMQAKAITISFNTTDKNEDFFTISSSRFEVLEYLSFQLNTKNAHIVHSKFVELAPGSINGTIENFALINNSIETVEFGAFSILSKNVHIEMNKFDYLKPGSFSKISPGLLTDSHKNFGKLKFDYSFKNNVILNFDPQSLCPDTEAYGRLSNFIEVSSNNFTCSCKNLNYILSMKRDKFYKILIDDASNVCVSTNCKNLKEVEETLKMKICDVHEIIPENLCEHKNSSLSNSTTGMSEIIWYNRSDIGKNSSNDLNYFHSVYIILLINLLNAIILH